MLENRFLKIAGFYGTMQNSAQARFSGSIFHDLENVKYIAQINQSNNCFTFNARNIFSFFSYKQDLSQKAKFKTEILQMITIAILQVFN